MSGMPGLGAEYVASAARWIAGADVGSPLWTATALEYPAIVLLLVDSMAWRHFGGSRALRNAENGLPGRAPIVDVIDNIARGHEVMRNVVRGAMRPPCISRASDA